MMGAIDTRMHLKTIIDYSEVYGEDKNQFYAIELIRGIPSLTLLNIISGFNIHLYLNENNEGSFDLQIALLNTLLAKAGEGSISKFKVVFQNCIDKKQHPVIFWRYSNLLFYEMIFSNFNTMPMRSPTETEAKNILDAYLIINTATSKRIQISTDQIEQAADTGEIESIVLPSFIYQRDYISNLDFSNQVTRCARFFDYLEKSDRFRVFVSQYYKFLKLKDYRELIYNILTIFSQAGIGQPSAERIQFIPLGNLISSVNIEYIKGLSINETIPNYKPDNSFRLLRKQMLFDFGKNVFFLLEISFLIDQLYKAQVFAFKEFIERSGYNGNFLSVKGKEFMEDIYFIEIMQRCFSNIIHLPGADAKKKDGNEICDYYLRIDENVFLIEFKDVLLNANIKDQSEKAPLYQELNKKFFENTYKDPKGIQQLFNAISYLEDNNPTFDNLELFNEVKVYPIVIYTDSSFGYEGVNKIFKRKFKELLSQKRFEKMIIKDVAFINLNYFELHEEFLQTNPGNFTLIIDGYHVHTVEEENSITSFEVFSRSHMRAIPTQNKGFTPFMTEIIKEILPGID